MERHYKSKDSIIIIDDKMKVNFITSRKNLLTDLYVSRVVMGFNFTREMNWLLYQATKEIINDNQIITEDDPVDGTDDIDTNPATSVVHTISVHRLIRLWQDTNQITTMITLETVAEVTEQVIALYNWLDDNVVKHNNRTGKKYRCTLEIKSILFFQTTRQILEDAVSTNASGHVAQKTFHLYKRMDSWTTTIRSTRIGNFLKERAAEFSATFIAIRKKQPTVVFVIEEENEDNKILCH